MSEPDRYLIANWKMHSPPLPGWVKAVCAHGWDRGVEVVLCPPFTQLAAAQMVLTDTGIALGAQDCHQAESGAHTGDIAASMLKKAGCGYVIVGHSERRAQHGEDNAAVYAKAQQALAYGLRPVICVGESLAEREAGAQEAVVERQLAESVPPDAQTLIAYEPVWAIGTGRSAQDDDIAAMHAHIKKRLDCDVPVLYGGSVRPENAGDVLAIAGVNGVLVGSASLKGGDFAQIVGAAGS